MYTPIDPVDGRLFWKKVEEQRLSTIELPTSYLYRLPPIKFTTELKMITKDVEFEQLIQQVPWSLDNALALSPVVNLGIAEKITLLTEVPEAEVEARMETISEGNRVNAWVAGTGYYVGTVTPMEMPKEKEVTNTLTTLQRIFTPHFINGLKLSAQDLLDTSAINRPPIEERAPMTVSLRLVFQQLVEVAQQEAAAIQTSLDQFKGGLERLILGPPRAVPARGAIRVRGEKLLSKQATLIVGAVVNKEWEIERKLDLEVEQEPQIRQGKLILSLLAPVDLIGRRANVILSTEGMEVLLGSVAVESIEGGRARIELEVDLEDAGLKIKDGRLRLEAFKVFIEPREPKEEKVD